MTPQHPLDLITRGVPSLQAWWDEYRAEDGYAGWRKALTEMAPEQVGTMGWSRGQ